MLENPSLPILEVNAGYPNSVADILNLEQEFLARGKPGILILPDAPNLELAASNAQFQVFSSLVLLEVKPVASDVIVEQVSWTQALTLARVWCLQHQALDWQEFVAKEITRALQKNPNLTAYLAFENHQAIGMLIALLAHKTAPLDHKRAPSGMVADGLFALESGFAGWIAGESRAFQALSNRLLSDFENAIISVPLEQSKQFEHTRVTDSYSVWVKIR